MKNLVILFLVAVLAFGAGVLGEKNCPAIQKIVGCPCVQCDCCCHKCPTDCTDCCKPKCGCGDKCKCAAVKADLKAQVKYLKEALEGVKDEEDVPVVVSYLRHLIDLMEKAAECNCCPCAGKAPCCQDNKCPCPCSP